MANIETLKVDTFNYAEGSAPSTPSSGQMVTYGTTDGHFFKKDDAGTAHILDFSGASVYHNTTQSVNNDTATAILYNSERFDTDGYHDTGSNTERLTIPTGFDGIYQFGATVRFPTDADGYRTLTFRKNGTDFLNGFVRVDATASTDTTLSAVGVWTLVATNYIEVVVRHTAGAALTIPAGSSTDGITDFWIIRLR